MRKNPLEKEIQRVCFQYLRLQGIFAFKTPNTGTYKQKTGHYIPAQTKGIPDAIMHWPLDTISYIEFKAHGGKLSDSQKEFQTQCEQDRIRYFVIRDLDELIEIMKK